MLLPSVRRTPFRLPQAHGRTLVLDPAPSHDARAATSSIHPVRFGALPDANIDLVDYAGLMLALSHLLGRKVDLASKRGLKPLIRASVIEQAQLFYAA